MVPFAAGGGTDLLARYWGQLLQKEFGQTFLVDVKPGAGGLIGTRYAAQSVPDGYTLLIATPAFALNPFLIKSSTEILPKIPDFDVHSNQNNYYVKA